MLVKRENQGFNLSFLDVMACGLGAVILIFMLVKFSAFTDTPSDEENKLKAELSQLQSLEQQLKQALQATGKDLADNQSRIQELQAQIARLRALSDASKKAIADKEFVLADLEKSVAAAAPLQSDDPIKLAGKGEEQYLLGLKVEGRHIGILLDHSASMAAERLVDIFKFKVGSELEKQSAPKWIRTQRVGNWLLARVPKTSKVTMVAFNDTAKVLTPKGVSGSSETDLQSLATEVGKFAPNNGTNLQAALQEINKAAPDLTDLYIVTDGLPTLGVKDNRLRSVRQCPGLFRGDKTIDGNCRIILFDHSVRSASFGNVRINVILLPLEGDPDAAQAYWNWTSTNGGFMITPADSWP